MKRAAVLLLGLCVAVVAVAGDAPLPSDQDIAKTSADAVDAAASNPDFLKGVRTPDHPDVQAVRDELAGLRESLMAPVDRAAAAMAPATPNPVAASESAVRFRLFVSQSQPDSELRAAAELASAHPDLVVVFRGFLPGQTAGEFGKKLMAMMDGLDPKPAMDLDPERFTKEAVETVPTLVAYADGKPHARVTGSMNPEVLDHADHDLGKLGTTYAVAEEDLIAAMQKSFAEIDLETMKAKATENYWAKQSFVELPVAATDRVRDIDPTFEVAQTIVAPDGTVIAREGDRVNPLDRVPFSLRLIAFDPESAPQRDRVKALIADTARTRRTVLLATRLDRGRAFDELSELSEAFQQPVYLLTPQVATTFSLERVPATVEAVERVFRVTEYATTSH